MALVLGMVVFGALIYMMPALSRMPINHVRVVGELREITEVSLREAISSHLAKGFFVVDVAAVRRDILKLPWMKSVSVRRTWPGSLCVAVLEHKAEARWFDGGLLATDGTLFQPLPNSYPADLPMLKGISGRHAEMLRQYRELRRVLRPIKWEIRQFTRTERPIWEIELDSGLDDGLVIVLENKNPVAVLEQFARTAPAIFGERINDVSRVDLRYANGFSVRWRPSAPSGISEPLAKRP